MSGEDDSLRCLRRSIASLPGCLEASLRVAIPALGVAPKTVVTTGIGASEAPARLLAASLLESGIAARFCEVSRFALDPPSGDLLVTFSQGLSPNARVTFSAASSFRDRWLVTSAGLRGAAPEAFTLAVSRGIVPIVIPPDEERGMLVRIVGPTVAALTAMRIAASITRDERRLARLADAHRSYRPLPVVAEKLGGRVAFVTAGFAVESAHAHRWKVLEGLLHADPPAWDVLQIAHGPLQSFHGDAMTLVVLERSGASELVERLAETLDPDRHRLVRLRASCDDERSFFEHAATIDAWLESSLVDRPRDLYEWPARGRDEPLYGFGSD